VGKAAPLGARNRGMLDARLPGKPVIPGAKSVPVLWGELSAGATRPRPVNDTWAAACCLAYGLPLATLNVSDFADFAEHDGLVLIRA
jgi:toxin FitB